MKLCLQVCILNVSLLSEVCVHLYILFSTIQPRSVLILRACVFACVAKLGCAV